MRVLVAALGAIGHIHPMVPLALALRDRGHDVLWATADEFASRLRSIGFEVAPAGASIEELRAEYVRRYPEVRDLAPQDLPEFTFPRLFGEVAAESMVDALVALGRRWRPDLIVQDQAVFAGAITGALVGVPWVTHAYGALLPAARVAAAEERVAPFWRRYGLESRPFGGFYDHLYLDIYPPSLQSADVAHVPRRQLLRPVPFDGGGDDDGPIWPRDGDGRPLAYLTLGTVARDIEPLRTAAAAIRALDVRLLVTVGPSADPAALGPQPPNVRVERYVPQTAVFEEAAVVASHAGSGTFLAAIGGGIPQLCLPQGADQFLNAAACDRAAAGLVLEPARASETAIAEAVGRLLEDGSFRDGARRVAADLAAMPSPAEVAEALETTFV